MFLHVWGFLHIKTIGGVPLLVDSPGNPFVFSENRFSCFALGALEHELPSHLQRMRQAPPIWDDALLSSRQPAYSCWDYLWGSMITLMELCSWGWVTMWKPSPVSARPSLWVIISLTRRLPARMSSSAAAWSAGLPA